MTRRHQGLKFVWPKEGDRGRKKRGFFGGLNDILNGKGPDIFIQKAKSQKAIKVDRWANWDGYHDKDAHEEENADRRAQVLGRRGRSRYDPAVREYVEWGYTDDWYGNRFGDRGEFLVPRFTREEHIQMMQRRHENIFPDPGTMGEGWDDFGPKRWRPEHDYFWNRAHRIGCDRRDNLSENEVPRYQWSQHYAACLQQEFYPHQGLLS